MHRVDRSILVIYSAEQMFDLVADVPSYPQFLPWCGGARVRELCDKEVEAAIIIAYRGVRSQFTTRNLNDRPAAINLELVDGPFLGLHGQWTFKSLRTDGCRVDLNLQYAFAAGLLGRAIGPVFDLIASSLIDAFSQRADALYGS